MHIKKENDTVTMPLDDLRFIKACLDNQKFMGAWNADAFDDPEGSKETDRENQQAIDDCVNELRAVCEPY